MLNKNSLETSIYGRERSYTPSANKYYNIFSKKLEEIDIPNIDLEFNYAQQTGTTFIRTA